MAEPPSVGCGKSKIIIDFLEEENLAFIGCTVAGAVVVDDVEVGELLS
jgi:hypothetical protein